MLLSVEQKSKYLNEREELKKRLKEITKILNQNSSSEFMKKDEIKQYCDLCNVSYNKYASNCHLVSKRHISNQKKYNENQQKKECQII